MESTTQSLRGGWQQEETEKLWQEVMKATAEGTPLRGVFEKMGRELGRKPNSVRNYYYMQLRARGGEAFHRAAPFEVFTQEEIHDLVKTVLTARAGGQSVRACVMELSGGDKALMLRLQNKYRSCLRKRPELIREILQEMQGEGLTCDHLLPLSPGDASVMSVPNAGEMLSDPDAQKILEELNHILARSARKMQESDRMKVQRDLALMKLEELQLICRDLIGDCKVFLGSSPDQRAAELTDFCGALSGHVARLESAAE